MRNVLRSAIQFKTHQVKKLRTFAKIFNLPAAIAQSPSRNENLEILLENVNKSHIELSVESIILLNFVNLSEIFCEGLSQKTGLTFN